MPLISTVGRKTSKVRMIDLAIYLILGIGSLTMLYPFMLMLSTSFTSFADYQEFRLVPKFIYSEKALFKKYACDKLRTELLGYEYGFRWYNPMDIRIDYRTVDEDKSEIDAEKSKLLGVKVYRKKVTRTIDPLGSFVDKEPARLGKIHSDWKEFFKDCPELYKLTYFTDSDKNSFTVLDIRPEYHLWLKSRFGTVAKLNKAYTENLEKFEEAEPPYENPIRQQWLLPLEYKYKDWQEFKKTLPMEKIWVVSADLAFQKFITEKYPSVEALSKDAKIALGKHSDLTFARAFKDKILPEEARDEFLRNKCPVIFLKLSPSCEGRFREFVKGKYRNFSQQDVLSKAISAKFSELCPMDQEYPGQANDWIEFLTQKALPSDISFRDPLLMYQDFLRSKYKDINSLNEAYGFSCRDFSDIRLPAPYIDSHYFKANRTKIFWKYIYGNYALVISMITVHGRALFNTFILIILSIACSITVNPLAAYALSRYRLRYTNSILLFLLATMAFPASVGMIPSFLLLRDLGLLNTFAALVLPGVANGFSIFLLKGFFDSLPQELFEASLIDGASEFETFCKIALPMIKPMLAIIALGAFGSAYGAFMFAFLTCQDPQMWTLMVFIYEFQQNYPNYVVMASLIVTSIPTLLVFILCQNIILRGIVVPSFK